MYPKLSLIIPVYNSELFIEDSINKLVKWSKEQNYSIELIIVNDGSTDNSKKQLEFINKENKVFKLISYPRNKGKGYAVKQGMHAAKGDFKVFTDADIPYGFNNIDAIIKSLEFENFDVCIGNRKATKSDYHVKTSFFRNVSSRVFTFFISKLVISGLGDTQCGLKGFTSEAAESIFSKVRINGFAFDVEALYLSYKYKLNIKRIPVKFEGNSISTINLISSSFRMFVDVLSLPINFHLFKKY